MYLDTNILIYLLEGTQPYADGVARQLEAHMSVNDARLVSATLVITEFLAGSPAARLDDIQRVPGLSFVAFDEAIAMRAGELQRTHRLKLGDAAHLATAVQTGCDTFFTNDHRLAVAASQYLTVIEP